MAFTFPRVISLFHFFVGKFGTHAYTNYALKLGYVLPESVRCAGSVLAFRKALKTHYLNVPLDPQNSNQDHSLSSVVIAPCG